MKLCNQSIDEDNGHACEFAFVMIANLLRRLQSAENMEKIHVCVMSILSRYIKVNHNWRH
jgi:hypothetical protein